MVRAFLIIVVMGLSFLPNSFGAEEGLVLRIVTRVVKVKEQPDPKVFYSIEMINRGEQEVTVLSRIADYDTQYSPADAPTNDPEAFTYKVQFGLNGTRKTRDGYLIIPSLADYEPVTLRKNECVVLKKPQPLPGEEVRFLSPDVMKRMKKVDISYFVTEEMGRRLGIWSGRVTVKYDVVDGVIQGESLTKPAK